MQRLVLWSQVSQLTRLLDAQISAALLDMYTALRIPAGVEGQGAVGSSTDFIGALQQFRGETALAWIPDLNRHAFLAEVPAG